MHIGCIGGTDAIIDPVDHVLIPVPVPSLGPVFVPHVVALILRITDNEEEIEML